MGGEKLSEGVWGIFQATSVFPVFLFFSLHYAYRFYFIYIMMILMEEQNIINFHPPLKRDYLR